MSTNEHLMSLCDRRSRPRLRAPAPTRDELTAMLAAAASGPDHGRLRPYRFVVLDGAALEQLGDVYAAAHGERDPAATPAEITRTRGRPLRAPMIVAIVAHPRPHPKVGLDEQRAAAACAAYGLLLAAHAYGYGAMWRTGWYGESPKVRAHLGVEDDEELTGWIYLGTPDGPAPPAPPPAQPSVTWLG